jgi:hypothetical protein
LFSSDQIRAISGREYRGIMAMRPRRRV